MTDNIAIKTLSTQEFQKWDSYVNQCPEGTFFHKAGWKNVIEHSFGHDTYYLYTEKNGQVTGILPLGHINSVLFGNALVSSPFCVYGGVIASDEQSRNKLYEEAIKLAKKLKVDHLEMRNLSQKYNDWPTKDLYVTFRKEIDSDPDVNMKAIPRKQRAMVRKGIKAGLVADITEEIEQFFNIYAVSVRNHGTPVFSKRYFASLKKEFGKDCEITVVSHKGAAVAAVMTFYFRNEVLPYYGGGTPEARSLKAFDFMYWDVMRRASENGVLIFDYGRSKIGTGSYSFKKNWGFVPQPLNYQYYLVKASELPDVNPLNPKYRMFINMWKRLPVPVSKVAGPLLSRYLG